MFPPMNALQKSITLLLTSILYTLTTFAQNYPLSKEDEERLNHAVALVDQGQTDSSSVIMKDLLKKYPKNYLVNYEYTYLLCIEGKFKEANDKLKKLEKYPEANDRLYQMIGNTYDYMGQPEKALKAYQKGLKKYPNSGPLYVEQGNLFRNQKRYNEALSYYEKGIEIAPLYPTCYLRASSLYLSSESPVWGMIYGEIFSLLKHDAKENPILCKETVNVMRKKLSMAGDSTQRKTITIHWNPKEDDAQDLMNAIMSAHSAQAGFESQYESIAETTAQNNGYKDTIDFNLFCKIRKGVADSLVKTEFNCGLFKFHKRIIEAGFWESYNMIIYGQAFPTEFQAYMENDENAKSIRAFVTWYNTVGDFPNTTEPTSRNIMDRQIDVLNKK